MNNRSSLWYLLVNNVQAASQYFVVKVVALEAGDGMVTEWLAHLLHSKKLMGSIPGLCMPFCVKLYVSLPMSGWVCLWVLPSTQNMHSRQILQPG